MRRLLLSISFCLLCFCVFSQENTDTACRFRFNGESASRYSLVLESERINISGICMMSRSGNVIKGIVFNEFGIRAFDFECDIEKQKFVMNGAIGFLNRRVVKKIVGKDFLFMLSAESQCSEKNRRFYCENDSEFILVNDKNKIKYIFAEISNS